MILHECFLKGMSLRDAANKARVSKGSAARFRGIKGGMDAYRKLGARFKENRWG